MIYVFLHKNLFEQVYIDLPCYTPLNVATGQGEHAIRKFHMSIDGLKYASRQWFYKFSAALI